MTDLNTDCVPSATRDYAEQIAIPEFDERAIRTRSSETRAPQGVWRRVVMAAAAAVVLLAATLNGRAVIAQVEQMMRAVLTVGRSQVPATIQAASLQEAQKDMPFTVIVPPDIPGYQQSIREVVAQSSPQSSRVLIQYKGANTPVPVTIMESSATTTPTTQIRFWPSNSLNGQPPRPMQPPPNGAGPTFHVSFTPQSWTVGGTRIDLLSPPGALTAVQMLEIRRAMSR
jgi:hypothetical protein